MVSHLFCRITGSFVFLPHRFISGCFMQSLGSDEMLLYYFLVAVGALHGIFYYGAKRICSLLKITREQYVNVGDLLIMRDLIAYDETYFSGSRTSTDSRR
ncbi:MAG: hypothetical protein OEM02_10005 [Desulfobulbaceae bacterium]|nr:hypothetical protein [Desulfobulbaceae bacterium]